MGPLSAHHKVGTPILGYLYFNKAIAFTGGKNWSKIIKACGGDGDPRPAC